MGGPFGRLAITQHDMTFLGKRVQSFVATCPIQRNWRLAMSVSIEGNDSRCRRSMS